MEKTTIRKLYSYIERRIITNPDLLCLEIDLKNWEEMPLEYLDQEFPPEYVTEINFQAEKVVQEIALLTEMIAEFEETAGINEYR
jgi:hypothetical protein